MELELVQLINCEMGLSLQNQPKLAYDETKIGLELDRQNESLFYRIYAHIRDSIKLMTSGSQEEQFLIEARRKYAKAIRNLANERRVDLRKYSIQEDNDGNKYVLVDTDQKQFYTTNNVKKLKGIANEYYKNNIQGNVYVLDDKNYTTNAKSKKKYIGDIKTLKNDIKRLKLRMVPELPNIIKVAQTVNFDDDTKDKHNFSKDGWDYKKAIVRYEGNEYEVLVKLQALIQERKEKDCKNLSMKVMCFILMKIKIEPKVGSSFCGYNCPRG